MWEAKYEHENTANYFGLETITFFKKFLPKVSIYIIVWHANLRTTLIKCTLHIYRHFTIQLIIKNVTCDVSE